MRPKGFKKFRNTPVSVNGHNFASKVEAKRYEYLSSLGFRYISDLRIHPRYDLTIGEVKVGYYEADFEYLDEKYKLVVEDVKGNPPTPVYNLKKKLMKTLYNIEIQEVYWKKGEWQIGRERKKHAKSKRP